MLCHIVITLSRLLYTYGTNKFALFKYIQIWAMQQIHIVRHVTPCRRHTEDTLALPMFGLQDIDLPIYVARYIPEIFILYYTDIEVCSIIYPHGKCFNSFNFSKWVTGHCFGSHVSLRYIFWLGYKLAALGLWPNSGRNNEKKISCSHSGSTALSKRHRWTWNWMCIEVEITKKKLFTKKKYVI